MAKTLDEAGVKRLIQEIKGANKNLNTPIPISTENTPESMAQNVKNIADYVEKAKAAGVDTTKSFRITLEIEGYPVEGSYDTQYSYACGLQITDDGYALLYNIDVTTGEVFTPCEIVTARSIQKVTSSMLDKGARNPIVITGDMTEVDEETYQKLLQEGTDVILSLGDNGSFIGLQGISNTGDTLDLLFGYSDFDESDNGTIVTYAISINTSAPHTLTFAATGACNPVPKSELISVLQEIDLTGTDAERKAKLDQFETDWKALTGADDLTGARFVGKFGITDDVERIVNGIMTYCPGDGPLEKNDNCFYGICNGYSFSEQKSQIAVKVSCTDGSLTITPLFSHLEAITIYTDNTPEHMQANLDNIAAYEANLQALGVDVTKGWNAPASFSSGDFGTLFHIMEGEYYSGIMVNKNTVTSPYSYGVRKSDGYFYRTNIITQASTISSLTTTSKKIVGAINEVNANAVHSDKLVPTLEAITIKTNNSTASKAANVAAIKAYVDNLKALGVDVTKGYMIPFRGYNSIAYGILVGSGENPRLQGYMNSDYTTEAIFINPDGTVNEISLQSRADAGLKTNSKVIVKAINEVNALAKEKADKSLNAKSLEAITIGDNTPEGKAATKAVIEAYRDNLTALGVDVTKGFMIPIKTNNGNGFIFFDGTKGDGYIKVNNDCYGISITADYSVAVNNLMSTITNYQSLNTTSKRVLLAINEVNALAKSKQDALTSGTNIKTVNGQSLLGSGNIEISGGGDVTAAGDNTFTGNNVFSGIAIADILDGTQYQITGDNGVLMFTSGATNEDIQLSGVATPTYSNSAANKKYVDDKVAAAGGGSAPVLVNIDDISGSAGVSVPVDVFNKIANAASAKTPIFGYSKLVNGPRTTYEIIPLYVKNVSTTADTNGSLSIQFIAENAYNSVGIMKRSDTECSILISSSRPFALDTSVDKSSTRGIQSSAVWNEIHSEPMTVNTATSGVTTLSSTDKHKILCYADSGTQQYNLPTSPVDGETFLFLKVKSGHTITIQSGTGNENIYDCSSGNSVVSKTIETSTKRKITVTYSSTVGKWFLMANDFLS